MTFASRTQFHVERPWGQRRFQPGEGPSRGLFREPLELFEALSWAAASWSSSRTPPSAGSGDMVAGRGLAGDWGRAVSKLSHGAGYGYTGHLATHTHIPAPRSCSPLQTEAQSGPSGHLVINAIYLFYIYTSR